MARYIDADKAIYEIDKLQGTLMSSDDILWKKNKMIYKGLCNARGIIDDTPTADVVPKSEVERLKAELDDKQFRCDSCDRIMLTSQEHRVCIEQAKADVAREIFEEIELWLAFDGDIRIITAEKFAELKKKYTEGENEKS